LKTTKTGIIVTSASAILALGVMIGQAMAYQEHMHAALDALRTAKSELEVAEHNKGGHRAEALRLTNAAIRQVEEGIEHAE